VLSMQGRASAAGPAAPGTAIMVDVAGERSAVADPPLARPAGNDDQPWNDFDPVSYHAVNYRELHANDRRILGLIADFFAGARTRRDGRLGLDVGTGTNLYPTLAMMPSCDGLTLVERGGRNLGWLKSQVGHYAESWDPYWETLVDRQPAYYKEIGDPRDRLHSLVRVTRGNIFSLPRESFDIGSMFFVAESITARTTEFAKATRCFVGSLRRYAPFAAAFMKNSKGYRVGNRDYAAVAVAEDDVEHCLRSLAHGVEISTIPAGPNPLRHGYDGLILATGYAGRDRRK
jgi:hypothetical protein